MDSIPNPTHSEIIISSHGLSEMLRKQQQSQFPMQHILWTDDLRVELPIRMGSTGPSALPPMTIVELWDQALQKFGKSKALSVKEDGKWLTITYEEYYGQCIKFASALLALNLPEWTSVNIIGFNRPEWLIAFFGAIFARCIPAGIYSTNSTETCEYIVKDSGAKIVVAENREYAKKYLSLLQKGVISKIVLYNDEVGQESCGGKVVTWQSFIASGRMVSEERVREKMAKIKPGNCCLLCYTSGTTGMPKGVMISHDNCTWSPRAALFREGTKKKDRQKIVSYLPLSHIAAFYLDGLSCLNHGHHLYFAQPTALQGTLMQTVQEVKPHIFFSVPRVWEKIYTKLKQQIGKAQGLQKKLIDWALLQGQEGSIKELRGEKTSWKFDLVKKLIFDKIKKALGLEEAHFLAYGGGPLDPTIRKFFLSLNFPLTNGYGMTQTTAPQSGTDPLHFNASSIDSLLEVGHTMPGGETKIKNKEEGGQQGEICMRGRNVCMGYLNNPQESSRVFDREGFLHSGDLGKIDKSGCLYITGRIKELIVTAGGENVPPVLIENQIRKVLPCISNVMVVGDKRPFLTCLISLLQDPPQSGTIDPVAREFLKQKGCNIGIVKEAQANPAFRKVILQGLKEANQKAISRAQMVHDFYLMPQDFSMANGTLTANLKLKRKEAVRQFQVQIEKMYSKAKL